jgi:hypothetical protein
MLLRRVPNFFRRNLHNAEIPKILCFIHLPRLLASFRRVRQPVNRAPHCYSSENMKCLIPTNYTRLKTTTQTAYKQNVAMPLSHRRE